MNHQPADADADPPAEPATEAVLAAVQDSVLRLAASFPTPPATLRVSAADVTIEATWGAAHAGAPPVGSPAPAPPAPAPGSPGPAPPADGRALVRAPTVGSFYRSPEPGAAPFVEVGDTVTVGQQVGIVETMKLMIPVHTDVNGTVVEVLRDNGESVEHGEALFAVEPSTT